MSNVHIDISLGSVSPSLSPTLNLDHFRMFNITESIQQIATRDVLFLFHHWDADRNMTVHKSAYAELLLSYNKKEKRSGTTMHHLGLLNLMVMGVSFFLQSIKSAFVKANKLFINGLRLKLSIGFLTT